MNIEEVYEDLKKILNSSVIKKYEDMSKHTSFKVGGKADIYIKVSNLDELLILLHYSNEKNIPLTVIGNGSNILVKDNGIRGITISLDFNDINIKENDNEVYVTVGSGVKLSMLAIMLQKKGITGFEFASRNSWNNRWSN